MTFEFDEREAKEIFRAFILAECYIDARSMEAIEHSNTKSWESWKKEEKFIHELKAKLHSQYRNQIYDEES